MAKGLEEQVENIPGINSLIYRLNLPKNTPLEIPLKTAAYDALLATSYGSGLAFILYEAFQHVRL